MNLSLKNKYKTRKPEETIKILKNFFIQEGFVYNIVSNCCSEIGTWSCRIELTKNGYYFLGANGKGATELFSLASGFSELYERYCNKCPFNLNIFYNFFETEKNYKKRGYIYHPEEKRITIKEILNYPYLETFFKAYSNNEQTLEKILKIILNNQPIGVPYISLFGKETVYLDPRLIMNANGSQGMAAGNCLEEAIIQSNSELYEKYVGQFFFQKNFNNYHTIDLASIKNKELFQKIKKIQKLGYTFYIIDLSYNFNLPVLMSILLEKEKGQIFINFGSFPVFDIALERIITELYQGIYSYKNNNRIVTPYKNPYKNEIISKYAVSVPENYFPEDLFNKIVISDYNKKIFINKSQNIDDLLNYCQKINKQQGFNVYWTNYSKLHNFYAVHLFCPELDLCFYIKHWIKQEFKDANFKNIFKVIELYQEILSNCIENKYNYNNFKDLYQIIKESPKDFDKAHVILFSDPFNMSNTVQILRNLSLLVESRIDIQTKLNYFIGLYNYKEYRKYSLLNSYVSSNSYTNEELLFILNKLFNFNIKEEEIEKALSGEFLIKKIFYEPIQKYIKEIYINE